jgi:hypothetical protein
MAQRTDFYHRLETRWGDRDLDNGFAARLHDPAWFLARQWQMGEHQGENATTPVKVECTVARRPIAPIDGVPAFDPAVVPAEALVESELEDWWTMGRRIRAGARLAADAALGLQGRAGVLFVDSPPPYAAFAGKVDGRAVWLARERLNVPAAAFGADAPPRDSPDRWDSARLSYGAAFDSPAGELVVNDHRGGPMDWYSADADAGGAKGDALPPLDLTLVPTPLEYPGAPLSRFWEIEDANVDIGGYAPDTAHFATMLLVELIYSHSDDWFLFPVDLQAGTVARIETMKVTDAFGEVYDGAETLDDDELCYPGLSAPGDFSLFRCTGLAPSDLVLWPLAEGPLESEPVERVQFGVDEHSNVLWALERIVDSRQAARAPQPPDNEHPAYPTSAPSGDLTKPRTYAYKPAEGVETHWHPYELDWNAEGGPAYVQRGLAGYGLQKPKPMPRPAARVLYAGTPEAPELHRISTAVMAGGGQELERRWQLARDMDGKPVLWIERQRRILHATPARNMMFDVLEESSDQ